MGNGKESKKHHWWPLGIQSHWADDNGDVSWITPKGTTDKKRYRNKNIGQTRRGHTLRPRGPWQTNFEHEFTIDKKVHEIVEALSRLVPDGIHPVEMTQGHLGIQLNRDLLLFIMALLIRIPSNRHRFELYPTLIDLPPDEEVGKANMNQLYRLARKTCETGVISNRHYTLLHSIESHFIYGDGCLDWLSTSVLTSQISGRALIALTPHLCIYVNTPNIMRNDRNYAAIRATPSMVERVNRITQIYSKERLFFLYQVPRITSDFSRGEFLQHASYTDELFDELDAMSGHQHKPGFLTGFC
jgi:hypothetical protein